VKIRIAIMGCGSIAILRHAPEIAGDPRCELAGAYDLRRERAEAIAKTFGGAAYDTPEALLGDRRVDAVYVCTANAYHAAASIAALEAGKHVMCEKPMAVSVAECRNMLDAAKRAGKILTVGQDMRFAPANVCAHDLIASGALGKVIAVRSSVKHAGPDNWSMDKGKQTWFFNKDAAVFGAMGDVGVHKMDLIRYLIEDEFSRLCALTGTLQKTDEAGRPIAVDDNALCLFETKNGVQGVMEASWCNYGSIDMSTDILCERGRLKILMDDENPVVAEYADGTKNHIRPPACASSGITAHFLDTILDGADNPNMGASGARTVAAVVACVRSGETRQWLDVESDFE
jgi:predicted dehydrogenase